MWSLLIVTLPARPNAVRLRVWRALKARGAGALRDGAYLLPAEHTGALEALADEVRAHGGSASVLALDARSDAQREELLALFDRGEAYAQWRKTLLAAQAGLAKLGETEARRRLRGVADALEALRRTDYYAGAAAEQAQADLDALRRAVDAQYSRGEPQPRAARALPRLSVRDYKGKRWATRARPWVDRLACAWFVLRFIDAAARIVWFADGRKPPRGAIGFDFDGARFTHIGARVTFEVMVAGFGLDGDGRLQRIGAAVHYLDAGGIPVAEAAGLEAILAGLRELHADDDALVAAALPVFDALYMAGGTA